MVGRVTQDAALKQSEKGLPVLSFNVAVNRARKVDDGWEERPHFFWLNLFGKRAENLAPYMAKGQAVSIEGHLEQDRWESNGVQHSKMSLVVDEIRLVGPGKKKDAGGEQPGEADVPDDDGDPDFDLGFDTGLEDARE
jgi:single-strand DNA-binding protein